MRLEPHVWSEYAIRNDIGSVVGIREDAPKEIKKAYEDDLKKRLAGIAE